MAKCECGKPAVFQKPTYCKEHFINYFETTVKDTIEEYELLQPGDRVAVGCSGGKDSTSLLYLLKKFHGNVTAIAIDEGIEGYRDKSLKHLKKFCEKHDVNLEMHSFKELTGKNLDEMNTQNVGGKPCTTCGTLRRYLLNKKTSDYDKIAVGHNLDDEAQSVLMNLFRSNLHLMGRTGPKTTDIDGFTQRIKPLYFLKEREIATYSYVKGFMDDFTECPNAHLAYRIWLRDLLNEYEKNNPGAKENAVKMHLKISDEMPRKTKGKTLGKCEKCGEPSSNKICNACRVMKKV